MEHMAVRKPVPDWWWSGWVTGDASRWSVLFLSSLGRTVVELMLLEFGAVVAGKSGTFKHNLTSVNCDFSQPAIKLILHYYFEY